MTLHTPFERRNVSVAMLALGLVLLGSVLGGCRASVWKSSYAMEMSSSPLAATAPVEVREITCNRMQDTMQEMATLADATNIHRAEWTDARKVEAKATLLRGLQVSENPDTIEVLGNCKFITPTTNEIRPDTLEGNRRISEFAREIGANLVVWSACSRGMGDRIQTTPVTSYTTGTDRFPDAADGRRRYSTYTETTTTWVPVRVTEEQFEYIAFFVRR